MNHTVYSTPVLNNLAHTAKQLLRNLSGKMTCLLLCGILFIHGQAQTSDTTLFRATGAFFALSVPDAEASSKWYLEKLGMKVIIQIPKQDKHTVFVLEGGGLIVELIQNDDALPLSKVTPGITDNILVHGIFKAGVIVEDLDKLVATFRERGVEIAYGPFPSQPDQRSNVIIRDNSGNLIQFFGK
jgi:catechol 2,3-dioxygenase-like lactoylglutathione lyase family enzyme